MGGLWSPEREKRMLPRTASGNAGGGNIPDVPLLLYKLEKR